MATALAPGHSSQGGKTKASETRVKRPAEEAGGCLSSASVLAFMVSSSPPLNEPTAFAHFKSRTGRNQSECVRGLERSLSLNSVNGTCASSQRGSLVMSCIVVWVLLQIR